MGRDLFANKPPEYLRAIGSKAKRALDTAIDTAGQAALIAGENLGLDQSQPIFEDAQGNKFNAKTGQLIEQAGLSKASQKELASEFPYGKPEAREDWVPPQSLSDQITEMFGRPSYDPVQFAKDAIDQSRAYAESLGNEQNQQ